MKTHILSGAGAGIGKAIAVRLAQDPDNRLILIGRHAERLEEVKKQLPNSDRHHTVACSVTDAAALKRAFQDLRLEKENVVSVIANAGIGGENRYGPADRWDEIIATNVKGVYILGNEAYPYLRAASEKYRSIVIVSSVVAHMGVPGLTAYCTSKAAVLGLMRSWAAQWAPDRILVNAVCPGWVQTQMAEDGIAGIAKITGQSYEEAFKEQMGLLPLKKISQPEEIAALVRFLVSGEQNSITGEEIQINNGAVMH